MGSPRARGSGRGFALLSPSFLDELRSRLTLSTLVGRSLKLQKAGREWKACCPFHNEKTPSFWVNDEKAFYHCFGCGAHGDAIRWMTEQQGLSFVDAVKELAQAAGLEMPQPDPADRERAQQADDLTALTERAALWYRSALAGPSGAAARAYLDARGIDADACDSFRLGFAPGGGRALAEAMRDVDSERMIEAGLLIAPQDSGTGRQPYDRFRDRLMIPIRDPRGRTIAFGGRIIGTGEPKYLNSPETPLFDKGRTLFNLDRAAPASRKSGRIVVVEGYLDVIALDQAGLREAVAPLGTALTEHQLELLWRVCDDPILCFDGDAAGQKAALRAAERALEHLRVGKQLGVAILPGGQDPDDIIRSGGLQSFEACLTGALPLATFIYRSELALIDPARPEQRAGLRARLDEIARQCSDRFVGEEFARTFRDLFYEDFGWKRDQRKALLATIIRTSERVRPDLARSLARSALYGLTRFPQLVNRRLDEILSIPLPYPDLQRLRQTVITSVLDRPDLDQDGIVAILQTHRLPELLEFDLQQDLGFGFARGTLEGEAAIEQLDDLIVMLSREHRLKDDLLALDRAAMADAGGSGYEAIESTRRHIRDAHSTLLRDAAEWGILDTMDGQ